MRAILVSAAAFVLGVSGAAMAQPAEGVIAFLDKNADGKCDLNEYLVYQVGRIPEFDKNADGEFTESEFKQSLQGRSKQAAPELFRNFNSEGGRTLSQREFLGYHAWVFKTYVDNDRDGFMSPEEWSAIMKKAG